VVGFAIAVLLCVATLCMIPTVGGEVREKAANVGHAYCILLDITNVHGDLLVVFYSTPALRSLPSPLPFPGGELEPGGLAWRTVGAILAATATLARSTSAEVGE